MVVVRLSIATHLTPDEIRAAKAEAARLGYRGLGAWVTALVRSSLNGSTIVASKSKTRTGDTK